MKKIRRLICIAVVLVLGIVGCTDMKQDNKIKDTIEKMTLEEKVGQMILAGFDGIKVNENLTKLVQEEKIGGVILFKRNIESSSQLKNLTEEIKTLNEEIPLFISVDEEGGRVSRLSEDIEKFPSAKIIGEKNSKEYAYENGKKLGSVLNEHGINMDHAPVLDIYSNPKNTVIGDRAFGTNEKIVSDMGIEMMKGLEKSNIIPTVKHFPGHGDTEVDSHFGLPIVYKTLDELKVFELVPFEKAINEGCDVVMVSHILLDKIDSKNPASLSKIVITDILRDDLGFDKVVMTDDMNMSAITNNMKVEKACVESIKAGTDILLVGSGEQTVSKVIDGIEKAIEDGEITEDRIDDSVYRILTLKSGFFW